MSLQNSFIDKLSFTQHKSLCCSLTAHQSVKMPCKREAYTTALPCVSVGLHSGDEMNWQVKFLTLEEIYASLILQIRTFLPPESHGLNVVDFKNIFSYP